MDPSTSPTELNTTRSISLKSLIDSSPLLEEGNFSQWKTRMLTIFKLLRVEVIINPTNNNPLPSDTNEEIVGIILSKIGPHTDSILNISSTDAKLLWKEINSQFSLTETSNQAQVYMDLHNLELNINKFQEFIISLKSIINQLNKIGSIIPPAVLDFQAFLKFPKELQTLQTPILHLTDNPTVDTVISHLTGIINENIIKDPIHQLPPPPTALNTSSNQRDNWKYYKFCDGHHYPLAPHPESSCRTLHPELRQRGTWNSSNNKWHQRKTPHQVHSSSTCP